MIEFPSAVEAVRATVAIQRALENRRRPPGKRCLHFRMGVNVGEVLIEGDDLYGDAVNVAARLQELASVPGICVSRAVVDHLRGRSEFTIQRLGERLLKNIADPVEVYRIEWRGITPAAREVSAVAHLCPTSPRSPFCLSST